MNKMKRNLLTAFTLLMAIVLVGCGNSDIIAKVNGEGIPVKDFEKEYYQYAKIYSMQYGEDIMDQDIQEGVTLRDSLKEEVMNKLIMDELIQQDAEEKGIEVTQEEIDEIKQNQVEMVGGEEDFKKYLESQDMTEEDFDKIIKKNIIAEKHRDLVFEEAEVTDEKVNEYFNENKEYLEKLEASHILLETEEEARNILNQLNEGKDFAVLAEEFSLDPGSAANGGQLGQFGRGEMVEEFEMAAFDLEEGEISEPIKTDHGFHIIKLTKKINTIDDLRAEIEEEIKADEYRNLLESLRHQAKVSTYMKNFQLDKSQEVIEMPEMDMEDMPEENTEDTKTQTNSEAEEAEEAKE